MREFHNRGYTPFTSRLSYLTELLPGSWELSFWPHFLGQLSGDVEVDKTFFGGHIPRSERAQWLNKTIVVDMVEHDGDIMTWVVSATTRGSLQNTDETSAR